MRVARSTWFVPTAAIPAAIIMLAAALGPVTLSAHENHAPLPTKGVTVAGNHVLLSDKAREAIGLTTAKVTFADMHQTVEVNARVELPWNQQSMITSLVSGKIDQVLAQPARKPNCSRLLSTKSPGNFSCRMQRVIAVFRYTGRIRPSWVLPPISVIEFSVIWVLEMGLERSSGQNDP